MFRLTTYLFFLILATSGLMAQERTKINIPLRNFLQETHQKNERIHLVVFGHPDEIAQCARENEGSSRQLSQEASRVSLPINKVVGFAAHPAVQRIVYDVNGIKVLNDSMLVNNRISALHKGSSGSPNGFSGNGVIMGFIDTGIDFTHPDFQDSTGKSRVLTIWDQTQDTLVSARIPQPYNYGQVWDSTDINGGSCTHDDDILSHGTNVAGIGAGNGLAVGHYSGVAPKADIIAVASDFTATDWLSTVADGVEFIFQQADVLDRPCVINISAGSYLGSHDGSDLAAQRIDAMLKAKNGRALVCAAGNLGHVPFHLGYQVTADTQFTWFTINPTTNSVFFELWADTSAFNQVDFAIGADQHNPIFNFRGNTNFDRITNRLNVLYKDSIMNNGNRISYVETYAERVGDKYLLQVYLPNPDSSQYYFRFMTTGTGNFDLWTHQFFGTSNMISSSLPSSASFPKIIHYRKPDTLMTIVSSFACLPSVITVGNYINRDRYLDVDTVWRIDTNSVVGEIAANSCLGPTRTGVLKPDVAASGNNTVTANRLASIPIHIANNQSDRIGLGGMHKRNGGTSMASPVVAGIVALYFEKCNKASYLEIKDAITANAYGDTFATALPNFKWGYGKVDAGTSLGSSDYKPHIQPGLLNEVCKGDSVALNLSNPYFSYRWNNGDSTAMVVVDSAGAFTVTTIDFSGCSATSDTALVLVLPVPDIPDIHGLNTTLYTTASAFSYQWYRNSSSISGALDSFLVINQHGQYAVEVYNEEGCFSRSDTLNVDWPLGKTFLMNGFGFVCYPNPASGSFFIRSKMPMDAEIEIFLYAANGRPVSFSWNRMDERTVELNVDEHYSGIFAIQLYVNGRWERGRIALY
jgi:subtilisin family serine protease